MAIFTKSQVEKAGKYLVVDVDKGFNIQKYGRSLAIMYSWRSAHVIPLRSISVYLKKKALLIDKNALLVQRLKRTPSIIAKLEREKGMSLSRMEDIAGCRVVVSTIKHAYLVRDALKAGRTRNILHRNRDYIESPKPSGYRGIHLIYQYNGSIEESVGKFVEMQIRTKVQHSWATAVEVVGTFTKQALKASQGTEEWKRFFKLASIAFADIEDNNVIKNKLTLERKELIKLSKSLDVINRLKAFAVTTNHANKLKNKELGYFLMILDLSTNTIKLQGFLRSHYSKAASTYNDYEFTYKDDKTKDVVLVAATSLLSLKKAYPNYFADTSDFSKNLEKVLTASET